MYEKDAVLDHIEHNKAKALANRKIEGLVFLTKKIDKSDMQK